MWEMKAVAIRDMDAASEFVMHNLVGRDVSGGSAHLVCSSCSFHNALDATMCELCGQSLDGGDGSGMAGHRNYDADAVAIAKIVQEQVAANAPRAKQDDVKLKALAGHSQNVHNSAVEGAAMTVFDELLGDPLPSGMDAQAMIEGAKQHIANHPAGLPADVARRAVEELNNPALLRSTIENNKRYDVCFAAVWNKVLKHRSTEDLARRVAEEISEGLDSQGVGLCAKGKFGRLVNALRGFVNVGNHEAANGGGEQFQMKFTQQVIKPEGLTLEERMKRAREVFDEFGVAGAKRKEWLDAINSMF